MSEDTTVLYMQHDGIATITLNRPQVYNAFNARLHAELRRALTQAERDPQVRCLVLKGAGKAFCSGQDIKEIPLDGTVALGDAVREQYNPLIRLLRSIPKPVIAAVHGVAAGAGMSLALACDLRVAEESARFVAAFANIGLVADSGLSYFLPRLIGHARALELCLLGGTLDAPTAYQLGMVSVLADEAGFPAAVDQLAWRLADGPALALGLMKRSFALSPDSSLEQVLDYEAQAQQIAGSSAEFREGMLAFREKRRPRFR